MVPGMSFMNQIDLKIIHFEEVVFKPFESHLYKCFLLFLKWCRALHPIFLAIGTFQGLLLEDAVQNQREREREKMNHLQKDETMLSWVVLEFLNMFDAHITPIYDGEGRY